MTIDKGRILTENFRFLRGPKGLRVAVALSAIPLFAVLAAFGIAPDTLTDRVPVARVVQQIDLVVSSLPDTVEQGNWQEDRIQRGDTVAALLDRLGVDDPEALAFLRQSKEARAVTQLRPGKTVRARTGEQGELLALEYQTSAGNLLVIERGPDGFRATEGALESDLRIVQRSSVIRSSLFAATDAPGIPDAVAIQIAEIFASDIDFHRDLRKGDRFSVAYEVFHHKGEPIRTGRVLAAEFANQSRTLEAVWFEHSEGEGSYYRPDGHPLRKAFLRSPLEFTRISSGFTLARYHPILQTWRAHKGIDYAAPTGTRVRATGDGVIEFLGSQGAYGNLVIVSHMKRFHTYYAHLSGFGDGLRKGSQVRQGDTLGFVGQTGLATGPHLHYEFHINGVQHDPLKVALPEAPPITAELRSRFEAASDPYVHQLRLLRTSTVARVD